MTSSSFALPASTAGTLRHHPLVVRYAPIVTIVLVLIAIWYVAAYDESFAGARRF
jgi:hypothetical protein